MSGVENGAEPVVDATVVEEAPSVAVAPAAPAPALAVAPQASAADLVARLDAIKEAQQIAMTEGTDYGVIPGTGSKPTLLKPGAEKLAALFQLDVQPSNEKRWEADHHLTVISRVTIFHAPTGARLGSGEGVCTTREKKYGKRFKDRECPECGKATIKRSKFPPRGQPQAEPGWYCFGKLGGCGKEFAADESRIATQEVGEVDNPDLPDLWNTIDKMATKRALVAAVLIVTGASAVFTQDLEDLGQEERAGTEAFHRASAEAGRTQEAKPRLDPQVAAQILGGIRVLRLSYKQIGLMLGAAGADGLSEGSPQAVEAAISTLTKDQAVKVEAHLEKVAQDQDATQPDSAPADDASRGGGSNGE